MLHLKRKFVVSASSCCKVESATTPEGAAAEDRGREPICWLEGPFGLGTGDRLMEDLTRRSVLKMMGAGAAAGAMAASPAALAGSRDKAHDLMTEAKRQK